jgi:hypothetical protein
MMRDKQRATNDERRAMTGDAPCGIKRLPAVGRRLVAEENKRTARFV